MKRLGIFDIDGTIFRWSLFIEVVDAFIKSGIFPKKAHEEIIHDYNAWHDRKLHYDQYLGKVIKTYYKYLPGADVKAVQSAVKQIILAKKDRVYTFTRDLIRKLKKEGHFLLIISHSPLYIVSEFASYWGFHQFYGTEAEIKNGKFTGRFIPTSQKDVTLDKFLKKSSSKFDLKKSIAVGDTESDISILRRVGVQIAFNPDEELTRYARSKEWRIVVESKDVIFDIKKFDIINKL